MKIYEGDRFNNNIIIIVIIIIIIINKLNFIKNFTINNLQE